MENKEQATPLTQIERYALKGARMAMRDEGSNLSIALDRNNDTAARKHIANIAASAQEMIDIYAKANGKTSA